MPSWRSRWTSTCHCERLRPSARARWSKRLRKRRAMSWRRKPKLRSGSYVMPAMMISRHSLSKLINTSATRSVHLGDAALVLLRHKWRVLLRAIFRTQQGHLDKRLARATIIRRRRVAIELGMWRSGLIGGASGSVTGGKAKLREPRGGKRSRGGNRSPLGDQEAVCGDAECGMVMKASPSSPFIVPKPEFLLEFLIVAL